MSTQETYRREACILNTAGKGWKRNVKGIIGKAIRKALGVKEWHTEPHCVSYCGEAECEGSAPRFLLWVTDEEMDKVNLEMNKIGKESGWDVLPVDCYHD